MKNLLIGCGSSRTRKLKLAGDPETTSEWNGELVTLDIEPSHDPDVLWDLNNLPLPFGDNEFDRLDAYETLEHCGRQGDYKFFFAQFEDFWRILKPGGLLAATVPRWDSMWAFGDPSHTRVISEGTLAFLDQDQYKKQVGVSPMSDFRSIYKGNFRIVSMAKSEHTLVFVLRAVK